MKYLLKYPVATLLLHVALGFLAKYLAFGFTFYYLLVLGYGILDIMQNRDRHYLTAFYALYLMGMEIVYRIGGGYLFWELGKYSCIAVLLTGLVFRWKPAKPKLPFWIYLLLLVPGIAVALWYGHTDPTYLRKLILQNMSGPLSLFAAGLYFYNTPIPLDKFRNILKVAVLPSIALVTLLFLGKSISQIDFATTSNFGTSGGFGPNQVSTMLGWGMVLLAFGLLNRWVLTYNRLMDILLFGLLAFRGLLTFSRGGMMAAIGAVLGSLFIVMLFSGHYRRKIGQISLRLFLAAVALSLTAVIVNNLTNNYLLYRYQGKSQTEILYGVKPLSKLEGQQYLSGRGDIINQEFQAFLEFPLFGVGAGQGTLFRLETLEWQISSHTELSRLIGEHGIFGWLVLIGVFIFLPLIHFFQWEQGVSRHWFSAMVILSVLTMFHGGMRLAMPGIAFGAAFVLLYAPRRKRLTQKKRKHLAASVL